MTREGGKQWESGGGGLVEERSIECGESGKKVSAKELGVGGGGEGKAEGGHFGNGHVQGMHRVPPTLRLALPHFFLECQ